jgi:hypothetical protein
MQQMRLLFAAKQQSNQNAFRQKIITKKTMETPYRQARQCFELSDKITACHKLFEDFQQERTDIQKMIFYIWLDQNELKANRGKDSNGNFGYGLKFIPSTKPHLADPGN